MTIQKTMKRKNKPLYAQPDFLFGTKQVSWSSDHLQLAIEMESWLARVITTTTSQCYRDLILQQKKRIEQSLSRRVQFRISPSSIYNLSCVYGETDLRSHLIKGLLFADGSALVAHSEQDPEIMTSCFAAVSVNFGQVISISKAGVMCQLPLSPKSPLIQMWWKMSLALNWQNQTELQLWCFR